VSAVNPDVLQDVIVGGAVISAVSAALVYGSKKEPEVCPSCAGTGGVKCFACGGTGVMSGEIPEEVKSEARRDALGRNRLKNECIACKGVGLLFCKRCKGSGYV